MTDGSQEWQIEARGKEDPDEPIVALVPESGDCFGTGEK